MTLSSHQKPNRGASNDWLTPPEIIEAVGPFDLDPCASVAQPWRTASVQYTVVENGLKRPWEGFAWVNPPFGPDAETWAHKLADHGNGVLLVPARTETRWFVAEVWMRADAVLFLHGRPHFRYPTTGARAPFNSGVPICLVGYGDLAVDRLVNCSLAGSLVQFNVFDEDMIDGLEKAARTGGLSKRSGAKGR